MSADALEQALQVLPVIEEKDSATRHARMARDFASLSRSDQMETLLLTGSHEARRDINERVRAELGLAGSGERLPVVRASDRTPAQKKRLETGNVVPARVIVLRNLASRSATRSSPGVPRAAAFLGPDRKRPRRNDKERHQSRRLLLSLQ